MTKLKSYNDTKVSTIWASPNPGIQVKKTLNNTMKNIAIWQLEPKNSISAEFIKFLFKAEHSSVMEHAVISFKILSGSRSWLAQITRHRMSSFTSSSQHYQDYENYDNIVHPQLINDIEFNTTLNYLNTLYKYKIGQGIPKEEVRQILPNAKAVNLVWTINARSLYNFMRLRMCLRNVTEIRTFCNKIFPLIEKWWPEYAKSLGPPCYIDGVCNQEFMTCGKKYTHIMENSNK